jgi:hypothetical protein
MLSLKADRGRKVKASDEQGRYRCSKCHEWKTPSEFNKSKNQSSGLSYACRPCMREDVRKYNLLSKYGISAAKFAEMLLAQGGKCACCEAAFIMEGKKSERPCVDHNHSTGEIRSLLCGRCNLAAGNVLDSSVRATQLARYLERWKC